MKRIYLTLLFIFLLSGITFSAVTGNINITGTPSNITAVTGIYGYTIQFCNITADCWDSTNYFCFLDFDTISSIPWQGWCNASSITSCYANGIAYASSTTAKVCDSTTSYRLCSSGNWSSSTSCGINQTCSAGNCSTVSSSSSTSSSSSSTTANASAYSSIKINVSIADFEIIQNNSASKSVSVKNSGNATQYNMTISLSGINSSWFSISPAKYNITYKNNIYNFTVSFSIPYNAEVKAYTVTITAATVNASVRDTKTFSLKVLPSNETTENEIKPKYSEYTLSLEALKTNITGLEAKGKNVSALRQLYGDIEAKLNQTNTSLSSKAYYNASVLLSEISALIGNLKNEIDKAGQAELPFNIDIVLVVIVIVIVAVILFLAYLFWPAKEERGYRLAKGWKLGQTEGIGGKVSGAFRERLSIGEEGILSKIKNIFKRKKKEKRPLGYELKK